MSPFFPLKYTHTIGTSTHHSSLSARSLCFPRIYFGEPFVVLRTSCHFIQSRACIQVAALLATRQEGKSRKIKGEDFCKTGACGAAVVLRPQFQFIYHIEETTRQAFIFICFSDEKNNIYMAHMIKKNGKPNIYSRWDKPNTSRRVNVSCLSLCPG